MSGQLPDRIGTDRNGTKITQSDRAKVDRRGEGESERVREQLEGVQRASDAEATETQHTTDTILVDVFGRNETFSRNGRVVSELGRIQWVECWSPGKLIEGEVVG